MPIYIDRDDDTTPDIKGVRLSDGTKYEFNYNTLKNKPCFKKDWPPETYLDEIVIPHTPIPTCLIFSSSSPFVFGVLNDGTSVTPGIWDGILEYSTDAENWTTWDGTTAISSGANNKIYLRGTGNTRFYTGGKSLTNFFISDNISSVECTGNIETILDYQEVDLGNHPIMDLNCFNTLFKGCTSLVTPPQLPAVTLTSGCYKNMFRDCTSLTTAPALPATALAPECYYGMFANCSALATAPQLPATVLAGDCYSSMFVGCSSLTVVPQLPATTLAQYCYQNMFSNCTSLLEPPVLPATTLVNGCYGEMFSGCTSLKVPPELPATTLVAWCYTNMFNMCSSIKLSETQTSEYTQPYRIPVTGEGISANYALTDMFRSTGGTFKGTPTINTTYYLDPTPAQ